MKKQTLTIFVSLLILISCVFAACTADKLAQSQTPSPDSQVPTENADYQAMIRELEAKIAELKQAQSLSDTERQKEMKILLEQLDSLKKEAEKQETPSPSAPNDENTAPHFLYTVVDGKATITGYTGDESRLVIPSAIDGYAIYDIADGAFSSSTLKSITVSNGIRRIDWFAFRDCANLESITLPSSITSIGYAAFPDTSSRFTVYCHGGSFAESYAKSYGLNYAVI